VEEGTHTGLSVSLDEWDSGSGDVVGITLRVDDNIVANYPYPTLNGDSTDTTSLQTYDSYNSAPPGNGKWVHLSMEVQEDGKLFVFYKGEEITPAGGLQTGFGPSAAQLVLAARNSSRTSNRHVDNVQIITVPSDSGGGPGVSGTACQFKTALDDAGASIVDPSTIQVLLDGAPVLIASITKSGGTTTIICTPPTILASGSSHTVKITYKDFSGHSFKSTLKLLLGSYTLIPAGLRAASVDQSEPGFRCRMNQIGITRYPNDDENATVNAERQMASGYFDPSNPGHPYPNLIDTTTFPPDELPNTYYRQTINIDEFGSASGLGAFNPNDLIPGLAAGLQESVAGEFTAYLDLKRGCYRFGVNSDDGFRFTFGRGLSDIFGITLGEFDGGRGASDSIFDVVAEADGLYPIRVLWWQGTGGINVEIFSVDLDTGEKILVNDPVNPLAIKAYLAGTAKSYVRSAIPVPHQWGGAISETPIIVTIADGAAAVGAITMTIDGSAAAPATSKDADITTLTVLAPAEGWLPGDHTVSVNFDSQTYSWEFNVARLPVANGAGNFVIEAEDFNAFGNAEPAADIMPYLGGAYAGEGGLVAVDYNNNDGLDSDLYRTGEGPNVNANMDPNGPGHGTADEDRANRGSWDVTTSFKIGWVDGADWENYTRTIPAGTYMVAAALSFDNGHPHLDQNRTNDNSCSGKLSWVTSNPGAPCQTLTDIGSFSHHGSGGWGVNNLVAMKDANGNLAVVRTDGTTRTLRFSNSSGDFDYFAFVLVSDHNLRPVISFAAPTAGGVSAPMGPMKWRITDRVTTVDTTMIMLKIDSVSKTPSANHSGQETSVSFTPFPTFVPGSTHTFELSFKDSDGVSQSYAGSFTVTEGFDIEAEDFDFDGGNHLAIADVMPYFGGAYNNLGAVDMVDYHNDDGLDSDLYRCGETPNNNMDPGPGGVQLVRDGWSLTTNFKIGWIGGGNWFNYTRTFPAGDYEVYAGISFDGTDAHQCHGTLQRVTDGVGTTTQTLEQLGTFDAHGTHNIGGWGWNVQVPLTVDGVEDGCKAVVHLAGLETIRYSADSGDYDYLIFRPAGPLGNITGIVNNLDGTVTVSWTGAGRLQVADDVTGPWTVVPLPTGTTSLTAPVDRAHRFARLCR
jgi:hypothetical protein